MSKPQEYSDKLRGDFRKYLLKIACNKSDGTLNESEILKAFDLAVQKQKLTTLEAEMLAPKQLITSKIDVSGLHSVEECDSIQTAKLKKAIEALNKIAAWNCTPSEELHADGSTGDYRHFDEPAAARLSRETLREIDP